jgi:hypothetical protein
MAARILPEILQIGGVASSILMGSVRDLPQQR